jgi:NAD(P)-dependent dehydrogenase (short-subunit alcohol dehydrogenase family)
MAPMRRLENKVAVIAGGATGIGAESARRLASEGASVIVGDVNVEGAKETAAGIMDAGGTATPFAFDLADEELVAALIQSAVDTYGGIDLLHANGAALDLTVPDTDVVDIDIDVWEQTLRVNLRGYLFCMRHAIPHMLRGGGGAIVCTSSAAAVMALPNMPAYMASKAGINALIRHVAARWGKEGIRCNGVSPAGLIRSPSMERNTRPEYIEAAAASAMSPRSLGEPADIAGAVAYLLSDDASWVNGQIISVGGNVV